MSRPNSKPGKFSALLTRLKGWVAKVPPQPCLTCQMQADRRGWLDSLLVTWGWGPILTPNGSSFERVSQQKHLYSQIETSEAWQDYQFRLTQLREGTRIALERGVVDAFGKTHEPEQRAVLYVIEELMGYVPNIHAMHAKMQADMQNDEARSGKNSLYGDDVAMGNLTSLL